MRTFAAALSAAALLTAASAAEDAILVLDASGSMWGEVDGRHKILIARDVMGDLLNQMPDDSRLGLVAYGHNRRGDCTDIETVAAVGADRETIRNAVNGLRPLGMTPLSASVQHAADELRYTEQAATVILVSDGEETCDVDPCELGAALEEAGIDFTAHVIGFDISTDEERRQLQCLADETGGTFTVASNANELADALQDAVDAAPPEPEVTTAVMHLRATDLESGPVIDDGLVWRVAVAGEGGEEVYATDGENDGAVTLEELSASAFDVSVVRPADGARAQGRIDLRPGSSRTLTLALEIPLEATVRPEPEDAAPVGDEILVHWTGPARDADWIAIAPAGAPAHAYVTYVRIDDTPITIRMPSEPGDYEVRYMLHAPQRVLAAAPIVATDVEASVTPPETAEAGSTINIPWTGPNYDGDYIYIAEPDMNDNQHVAWARTDRGEPAEIRMPSEAGTYEARYLLNGRPQRVLARATFEVTAAEATVSPPETVEAGATFEVAWTGPDNEGDYIYIAEPDMNDAQHVAWTRTDRGDPAELRAPPEPGVYEARYVLNVGTRVIARATFEITAAEATVSPPETVVAGSSFEVPWTGPDNEGDYIYIAEPDANDAQHLDWTRTDRGNPAELDAPSEPGTYEARYILNSGTRAIARTTFEVTAAEATVSPPETVEAGATVEFPWTGPDNDGDYIYLAEPDMRDNQHLGYTQTRRGNPAEIRVPAEPGTYEIRYVLHVGTRVIARATFEVTTAEASLTPPESVEAGAPLSIPYTGPENDSDYIYVAEPDARDNQHVAYARTIHGNPAEMTAPGEAGEYEARYILGAGTTVIARAPLTVTEPDASVSAPASVEIGSDVTITWTGPENSGDYVYFSEAGSPDNQYTVYARASAGNPTVLRAPGVPGEYEARYILGQGTRALARQTVTLTPATAAITEAPASAQTGETITVAWDGPGNDTDYVAVSEAGSADTATSGSQRLRGQDDRVELRMPSEPGDYELRYVLGADNVVLARRPITITAAE